MSSENIHKKDGSYYVVSANKVYQIMQEDH